MSNDRMILFIIGVVNYFVWKRIFCSLFHFFQIIQMMKLSYMDNYCEMYKFNLLSQATTTSFRKKLQRKIRNYVNYYF